MPTNEQPALLADYAPTDTQRHYWRGFTLDHDEADAAQRFAARYGQPPAHIIEAGGILLVGPIPPGALRDQPEALP